MLFVENDEIYFSPYAGWLVIWGGFEPVPKLRIFFQILSQGEDWGEWSFNLTPGY